MNKQNEVDHLIQEQKKIILAELGEEFFFALDAISISQ